MFFAMEKGIDRVGARHIERKAGLRLPLTWAMLLQGRRVVDGGYLLWLGLAVSFSLVQSVKVVGIRGRSGPPQVV